VGAAIAGGGRATGRAAMRAARTARDAYYAVDEDVRVHLAQAPFVGLSMLVSKRRAIRALPDDGHRPVLLVHGFASGPGVFLPLQLYLKVHGHRRTYAVSLPNEGVEEMSAALSAAVLRVCRVNRLGKSGCVDIVAHSMGGLVARLALERPSIRRRVATLVTLGTPHGGTHAARYLAKSPARDLRPDSELLARLKRQMPWRGPPTHPRLVAFWSASDVLLLPSASARAEGARNVELRGFTHLSYLLDPRGFRRVLESGLSS
jgi:triacylglycerol lipase